jgi:hypothetical protein
MVRQINGEIYKKSYLAALIKALAPGLQNGLNA